MIQTDSIAAPVADKAGLSALKSLSFDDFISKLAADIVNFFIDAAIAVAVFYVGKLIIRKLYGFVAGVMVRRNVDKSLSTFVLSLVQIVLYFILIVTVIGILGINTSSFIALFASAGVAIGMALSGTLQNFAGGVLILLLKPYRIGDFIEAQGFSGTVTEIQIFSTIICTADNKSIIIPNGGLSTGTINNWSREDYRRVEWTVSLSYGDDVATAKKAILDILESFDEIVKDDIASHRRRELDRSIEKEREAEASGNASPADNDAETEQGNGHGGLIGRIFGSKKHDAPKSRLERLEQERDSRLDSLRAGNAGSGPTVNLSALADSSINFTARAWVPAASYWPVFFAVNERLYNELPAHGLHFPFPQLDVNLRQAAE